MPEQRTLTESIIGLAIEAHRTVGSGLRESVYAACVDGRGTRAWRHRFESQATVPVIYKGRTIPLGFRADIIVENAIILESKAVAALLAVHEVQHLSYLCMTQLRIGVLMNFPRRKDGLRRLIV